MLCRTETWKTRQKLGAAVVVGERHRVVVGRDAGDESEDPDQEEHGSDRCCGRLGEPLRVGPYAA